MSVERIVAALKHPWRVRILELAIAQDRVTPRDLAAELDVDLSRLSYHVRALRDAELLELVEVQPTRNALVHVYRAAPTAAPALSAVAELARLTTRPQETAA